MTKSEKTAEEKNKQEFQKKLGEASSLEESFKVVDRHRKAGEAHASALAEKRRLKKLGKKQFEPMISHKKLLEEIQGAPSLELALRAADRQKKRTKQ